MAMPWAAWVASCAVSGTLLEPRRRHEQAIGRQLTVSVVPSGEGAGR